MEETKFNIIVNPQKCTGCLTCIGLAPETFKMTKQGVSEVFNQTGNSDDEKMLAAQSCPAMAIEVFDLETKERLWPKE